jgi:hypothetical protein
MAFLPLDGPSTQFAISLTSTTVQEVKSGSSALDERKLITLLPTNGKIYIYFGDGSTTPSANDVQTKGFPHPTNALRSYEASSTQEVYIVADTGTVDVRASERA